VIGTVTDTVNGTTDTVNGTVDSTTDKLPDVGSGGGSLGGVGDSLNVG
jgi:hypothetical protein